MSVAPGRASAPRQTIVFTGHMVDAPGRAVARFPAARVEAAARRIDTALAELGAGREDLAFTQGAAGGDLLFAEACLARAVPLRLLAERLRCICLWDGGGSDGPGGTRHLVDAVRAIGGPIVRIDTNAL